MLKLSNVESWKRSLDAISSLINEGSFEFSKKGVRFRALDPSQVAFVDFSMPATAFEEFKFSEDARIGLDVSEFSKIVSRSLSKDTFSMDLRDSDVVVKLEGELSRKFKIPLIDVSGNEGSEPAVDFSTEIEIPARLLKESFKDAALFSNTVLLRAKKGKFIIETNGPRGQLKNVISESDHVKIDCREDVTSKYSLNFLNAILREADSEDLIKLSLKSESAVRVSYELGDAELSFYLAHILL